MNEYDPLEEVLEDMNDTIPPSPNRDQIRASFLVQAHELKHSSVSNPHAMRLSWMKRLFTFSSKNNQGDANMKRSLQYAGSLIGILILMTGVVWGQDILEFITQHDDDEISMEIIYGEAPPVSAENPTIEHLTLGEVSELAEFEVMLPIDIPSTYSADNTVFHQDMGSVWFTWKCSGPWSFAVRQHPMTEAEASEMSLEVGASAEIESVMVGDISAQYVRGEWRIQAPRDHDQSSQEPVAVTAVWNPISEFQRLVWYANGVLYTVETSSGLVGEVARSGCALEKEDYIQMAESLTPVEEILANQED
jgi:hypothetical protein